MDSVEDVVQQQIKSIAAGTAALDKAAADALKKRKLVSLETWTTFSIRKVCQQTLCTLSCMEA